MNKKSLILSIILILLVFISASAVSADDISDVDDLTLDESQDTIQATSKEVTINTTDSNDQIQAKINTLEDGDTLNFQKGDYKDICLYINKSVTVNGNGATLYGYDNPTNDDIPDIILNTTQTGGYAITNKATLYLLKTDRLVLKDLNFVAGANSGTDKGADSRYSNCVIYNYFSNHTTITNISVDGCSWGIWFQNCQDGIIENNNVRNQMITGIFNFQSPRTIIRNNTVTNAKNHGIDVRHGVGPNVKVLNNTVIGSKEGIYLLHSAKHVVTGNTIKDCSLSSITCCGASHILIENNKLLGSRIGILLGGGAPVGGTYTGYNNITIGANEWKFDKLPMPPSFEFYVAEAKGDHASIDAMMGTYTSTSVSNVTYVEYTGIETPKPIVVDYDTILKPTGNNVTISAGMNNSEIQSAINAMKDGDTLIFEKDAVFEDICIYIANKHIKIIGNNATLKGLNTTNTNIINSINLPSTYNALLYSAVIYSVNNSGVVISNLNVIANYPNYSNPDSAEYKTACIYGENSKNLTITGCNIVGASWGLFVGFQKNGCQNSILTNNKVSNQYTTGIICFGSQDSIIVNNTVTNAKNHGIDVRFKANGNNVIVFNNTVSGAKEGIYLLHSSGHKVYGNTILNSKISSITCYGSSNEYIFNNTLSGSRIAILLGEKYENVTIGKNTYKPDKLPFPPTFEFYLVQGEFMYQSSEAVIGTYRDSQPVNLTASDVTVGYKKGTFEITLKDSKGKAIANKAGTITIADKVYEIKTDDNGKASINLTLTTGNYTASVHTVSDYYNKAGNTEALICVKDDRKATSLTASSPTIYLLTAYSGYKYSVILEAQATTNSTAPNNKVLANKTVTIVFNGKPYTATTNENGIATVTLKANKIGNYRLAVSFEDDDEFIGAIATPTIKVIKEASKLTAPKKVYYAKKAKNYVVALKTKSGKPIAKAKLVMRIGGKNYYATTLSNGKALFKLNKLTKKGTFTAVVKYSGNAFYNGIIAKAKIRVK